jgi:hypothetical protein
MHQDDIPDHVHDACAKLQLAPYGLTRKSIIEAWKYGILPFLIPQLPHEMIAISAAKEVLIRWLDDRDGQVGVVLNKKPSDDDKGIVLPLP